MWIPLHAASVVKSTGISLKYPGSVSSIFMHRCIVIYLPIKSKYQVDLNLTDQVQDYCQ